MIITLCGSAKFAEALAAFNAGLSQAGHVVYAQSTSKPVPGAGIDAWDETKRRLDLVHLRKIMVSDAIAVINPRDHVGESTRREIDWATLIGKEVFWLDQGGYRDRAPVWVIQSIWHPDSYSLGDQVDHGELEVLRPWRRR